VNNFIVDWVKIFKAIFLDFVSVLTITFFCSPIYSIMMVFSVWVKNKPGVWFLCCFLLLGVVMKLLFDSNFIFDFLFNCVKEFIGLLAFSDLFEYLSYFLESLVNVSFYMNFICALLLIAIGLYVAIFVRRYKN
jgi:hypothetical protein